MGKIDILVIGGGITGLTAAIRAAQGGAQVAIVDAGENAGSTANAGSLHVQLQSRFIRLYPDQAPNVEASLPLYLAAVAEWDRLEAEHGPFEMMRAGGLMLAEGEEQLRFLEHKARREERYGLNVEIVDRPALDRLIPGLGDQISGAELCRDEGKLNPLVANARLRALAQGLGIHFSRDRIMALATQEPHAVGRNGTVYRADTIVVASAWGAGALAQEAGLSIPSRAEPLHMNITEPAPLTIRYLLQHAERSITLKQFNSGQIVIGGGWAAASTGDWSTPRVLAESLLGNVGLAARLMPSIAQLRVIRTWAGMNTTIDGKSVIGRAPAASRIIFALPGDAGYTLGPLCGRVAAEIALGVLPALDPLPYAPDRFSA